MRVVALVALDLVVLLALGPQGVVAQVGPPTSWELRQNDPDPFCSNPGATRIDFLVPQSAQIELVVLSSDGNDVVRTLMDGMLAVGAFSVVWNGRDANDVPVPNGTYPYRMTATDAQSAVLFQDTKTATVECVVGVRPDRWGAVKQIYR
jgi:hypothetical protein